MLPGSKPASTQGGGQCLATTRVLPSLIGSHTGSASVLLTFDGTRDAKVRDRDIRVRIALSGHRVGRLWRLLGERLVDEERLRIDRPIDDRYAQVVAQPCSPRRLISCITWTGTSV